MILLFPDCSTKPFSVNRTVAENRFPAKHSSESKSSVFILKGFLVRLLHFAFSKQTSASLFAFFSSELNSSGWNKSEGKFAFMRFWNGNFLFIFVLLANFCHWIQKMMWSKKLQRHLIKRFFPRMTGGVSKKALLKPLKASNQCWR